MALTLNGLCVGKKNEWRDFTDRETGKKRDYQVIAATFADVYGNGDVTVVNLTENQFKQISPMESYYFSVEASVVSGKLRFTIPSTGVIEKYDPNPKQAAAGGGK